MCVGRCVRSRRWRRDSSACATLDALTELGAAVLEITSASAHARRLTRSLSRRSPSSPDSGRPAARATTRPSRTHSIPAASISIVVYLMARGEGLLAIGGDAHAPRRPPFSSLLPDCFPLSSVPFLPHAPFYLLIPPPLFTSFPRPLTSSSPINPPPSSCLSHDAPRPRPSPPVLADSSPLIQQPVRAHTAQRIRPRFGIAGSGGDEGCGGCRRC